MHFDLSVPLLLLQGFLSEATLTAAADELAEDADDADDAEDALDDSSAETGRAAARTTANATRWFMGRGW
jgi:hypothetical protein